MPRLNPIVLALVSAACVTAGPTSHAALSAKKQKAMDSQSNGASTAPSFGVNPKRAKQRRDLEAARAAQEAEAARITNEAVQRPNEAIQSQTNGMAPSPGDASGSLSKGTDAFGSVGPRKGWQAVDLRSGQKVQLDELPHPQTSPTHINVRVNRRPEGQLAAPAPMTAESRSAHNSGWFNSNASAHSIAWWEAHSGQGIYAGQDKPSDHHEHDHGPQHTIAWWEAHAGQGIYAGTTSQPVTSYPPIATTVAVTKPLLPAVSSVNPPQPLVLVPPTSITLVPGQATPQVIEQPSLPIVVNNPPRPQGMQPQVPVPSAALQTPPQPQPSVPQRPVLPQPTGQVAVPPMALQTPPQPQPSVPQRPVVPQPTGQVAVPPMALQTPPQPQPSVPQRPVLPQPTGQVAVPPMALQTPPQPQPSVPQRPVVPQPTGQVAVPPMALQTPPQPQPSVPQRPVVPQPTGQVAVPPAALQPPPRPQGPVVVQAQPPLPVTSVNQQQTPMAVPTAVNTVVLTPQAPPLPQTSTSSQTAQRFSSTRKGAIHVYKVIYPEGTQRQTPGTTSALDHTVIGITLPRFVDTP